MISEKVDAQFSEILAAVSVCANRHDLAHGDPIDDNDCSPPCQRKILNFGPYHLLLHYSENHPQPYMAVTLAHTMQSEPADQEIEVDKILDVDLNQVTHCITGELLWQVEDDPHTQIPEADLASRLSTRVTDALVADLKQRNALPEPEN